MEKRTLAVILSLLIPGLGHLYSRKWIRGIVILFLVPMVASYLGPELSGFTLIYVVVVLVVAQDAYKVAPKGHLPAMITMFLIGSLFLGLSVLSLKFITPLLGLFFMICSLIPFSMMRGEDLQANAILRIRNTISQMGFSSTEEEEITTDVVRILKAGGNYKISGNPTNPIEVLTSAANPSWVKFDEVELVSVIKTVLDIRDKKKGQS